jgi:hypothetical protein
LSKTSHQPPVATWLISPEKFKHLSVGFVESLNRKTLYLIVAVIVLAGFGLRAANLSAEGLSEDELNKLQAVADYREFGLSPANAEHPMLMKAVQTASVVLCERWNAAVTGQRENLSASPVSALQESARRRQESSDDVSQFASTSSQDATNRQSHLSFAPETGAASARRVVRRVDGALDFPRHALAVRHVHRPFSRLRCGRSTRPRFRLTASRKKTRFSFSSFSSAWSSGFERRRAPSGTKAITIR